MNDSEQCALVVICGIVFWVWATLMDRIYGLESRCDLLEKDIRVALKGVTNQKKGESR